MKIGRLLFLSGMPRPAFDNFERRGHLSFLKQTRSEGVDRFEYPHAMALAVFWRFREIGMEPSRIAEIIDYHWRQICTVARGDAPETPKIGLLLDSKGRRLFEGDRRADCAGEPDLAGVFVDLIEMDADLRPQLSGDEAVTGLE